MSSGQRFHPGEQAAQQRFDTAWDEGQASRLANLIGEVLDEEQARFVESVSFFFLATADAEGNCDCSFKGSEPGADEKPGQAVWVVGPRRLLFPDYPGNRLFNSLGNILANPHAGMLFIDFPTQKRLRVNGMARVLDGEGEWRERWPQAARAVEITVEQVYWNCSKRIPQQP